MGSCGEPGKVAEGDLRIEPRGAAMLVTLDRVATHNAITTAMRARLAASGQPGTASTMPMSAQNTMSCTTRGLVSW